MRTIWLVRHADAAGNGSTDGPEIERGWLGLSITSAGRKQARRAAVELAELGIKALVSSDLPRAKQTTHIIGDWLGIEPDFVSQLRTWNTGEYVGKRKREVEPVLARLVRFAPDRVIPGGESFDQFTRRAFAALADVLARHSQDPLALVIHGRIERLFKAWKVAGEKRNHAIDADTFLARTEKPGHIEPWKVDPAALKLSHAEADFGDAKAKGDRCGRCKAYGGVNKCTKVNPPMDADDWCAAGVARSGRWFSGNDRLPRG